MNSSACFPRETVAPHVCCGVTRRQLTAAYELVYTSYVARGYTAAHPGGIVYQSRFGLPGSRTLIANSVNHDLVGTITVVGDTPWGFEAETTFPEEVGSLRRQGLRLAELTCLAIRPDGPFRPRSVFFALTKYMIHYVYWRGYDALLLAIHPRHYMFYWRFFRAYPLGPTRSHEFANGNPAIVCGIDLHTLKKNADPEISRRYFSRPIPADQFARPSMRPVDHAYFCHRCGIATVPDYAGNDLWHKKAA